MFRRKGEESLFDTPTDQPATEMAAAPAEQPAAAPASTMAPVSSSPATAAVSAPAASPLASGMANNPLSRPAVEPRAESRPVASQPSSFRPASNPMAGTRMPEPKAAVSSSNMGMSMTVDKAKGGRRVLTVGNDILLKGEIATCDRLVIEGKVDATLNDVHTVEISETGSFKGSANIEDAEISGLFEGDLVVRNRLVIYATGKVRGKITYGEIEIERGGELTGEIKTNQEAPVATASRPSRSKEDKYEAA